MAAVGTLEEEARKRKERLKNLKNKKGEHTVDENSKDDSDREVEKLPK